MALFNPLEPLAPRMGSLSLGAGSITLRVAAAIGRVAGRVMHTLCLLFPVTDWPVSLFELLLASLPHLAVLYFKEYTLP